MAPLIINLRIIDDAVVNVEGSTGLEDNRDQFAAEIVMIKCQGPARDYDLGGIANVSSDHAGDLVRAAVHLQNPGNAHRTGTATRNCRTVVERQGRSRGNINANGGGVRIGDDDAIKCRTALSGAVVAVAGSY